ncbi:hypothetical protein BGZ58_008003 [Dissophora ornata]|nr:hypothetical protein BGZ58_008003 [Dissophora ornata]
MSKKSAPAPNLLGVRRHGVGVHRVEKKLQPASSWTLRSSTPFNSRIRDATSDLLFTDKDALFTKVISESEISLNDEGADTTGVRGDSMLSWSTGVLPASNSSEFIGTRSVRQDRPSALVPGKRQEEIYLSQARLLQWFMMSKRAAQHFENQEKSAEAQFKAVEQSILEQEEELQILQKRLNVEKEFAELESNLGCHRDRLLAVISELQSLKGSYGALSTAIDNKSGAPGIPGIDEGILQKWLAQIQDCRVALDTWSKRNTSKEDEGFLLGVTRIMKKSCDAVKQEIQELLLCLTLLSRIREAESLESSLLDLI